MRFEYCIACCLTLVYLASAGPILQRSRNPDLSPLTKAANAVSSLPPEKAAAISAAARQERGMLFDVSDVVEQRIAAYNEACVVIHDQSLSTMICSTADTPPSASPTSHSRDSPATTEHSSEDKSTRTETVVVTRQRPQTAPPSPPGTNPPRPNDTPKPPAIMSLAAMSSKIVPVLPGTQDPDMQRAMASTSKTATETIRASKVQNSPANTSPLSPFPFSFPWSLPLSWLPIPDIDLDINSIIAPILSTILPQATEVLARPTGTTTTIHLTKTFVKTMTMPPPETAPVPVPAPAPAPPETNSKSPQQPPPQKVNEGQMMTTTVYVTACNPVYSAAPVLGENDPSARPPPPPAQAAPTEVPSKKLAPPPSLDNPEPPKTTPPPDAPSGGDGRGGGGHDGGHGGGGQGGGGQGNGKGHDDDDKNGDDDGEGKGKDKGRGGASFRPITIKDKSRGDGGGLIGVITRAADDLLFN